MSEDKSGGGASFATKARYKTPENFFPVVVDDFFNDPEALVDYGKSLPSNPSSNGYWPGKRSKNLWRIDNILCSTIILKILSCYYDVDYITLSWDSSEMSFQEIPRFSENKNDIINKGWIHRDDKNWQLAGLIYLTPNIDPDSGTSLYDLKSKFNNKDHGSSSKFELFKDGNIDEEEYIKDHIKQEEDFFEKVRFQNIFNRLIMYDTCEWHRANSYYNGDGEDARFTLSFFIGGISIIPLERIKNSEYETIIKDQIGKK